MAEERNVGQLDSILRIILGIASLVGIVYYFAVDSYPIYLLVPLFILVPFFLKTGATKVCPIMKAMGVSTTKKEH